MSETVFVQVSTPSERQLRQSSASSASAPTERQLRKSSSNVSTPSARQLRKSAVHVDVSFVAPVALYASVLVALMLPFQFGWSLSQLNLSTFASQDDCDARPVVDGTCLMFPGHSKADWTYVVNAWIVGGMVGSLTCGSLADKYGRRKVLMASALFMIVGGIIQASTSTLAVFIVGRVLAGISSGCATGMVGGYVNEIAPPALRGTLGGGLQISISLGTLLVVCTFFFANTSSGWRYIAGFPIVWGGLFLSLASVLLEESPAWLLTKARREDAAEVMARIYGPQHVSLAFTWFEPQVSPADIESPRVVMAGEEADDATVESQSTTAQLLSTLFRRQLLVAIGIASAQQLSGISAVFYYSSEIFKDAGIADDRIGSLIVNIMNLLPPFTTGYFANKFGYRRLLLFGFLGMLISAVGITLAFLVDVSELSIVFTASYVAVYSMSLGPLVYVVTADLFPDSVRGSAVSICIFFNWLSNLITGIAFPYIADALGDWGFLPFIAILVLFYFFTLRLVPETRGKTSDAIQDEFRKLREPKSAALATVADDDVETSSSRST